jgi:hypothetical protein
MADHEREPGCDSKGAGDDGRDGDIGAGGIGPAELSYALSCGHLIFSFGLWSTSDLWCPG